MKLEKLLLGLSLFSLSVGCAGTTQMKPAPAWFVTPPKAVKNLLFVGDATQQSEAEMARDLAVQKALFQLSLKVGAKIESRFDSKEAEVNGVGSQEVSLEMSIAGEDITARGVSVKKLITHHNGEYYNAYALIEWPKAEYEALLRTQQTRAEKALRDYLAAKDALTARKLGEAARLAKNAKKATPNVPLKLNHPDIPDTSVLARSVDDLVAQAKALAAERAGVCALGVFCERDGKSVPCDRSRRSALNRAVTNGGAKVSSRALSEALTRLILDAGSPELTAENRDAGCLVAVSFSAEMREKSGPFIFINYSARASIYDVESGRILKSHEVAPTKMGHVKYKGAMKKGFNKAQKQIVKQIADSLKAR